MFWASSRCGSSPGVKPSRRHKWGIVDYVQLHSRGGQNRIRLTKETQMRMYLVKIRLHGSVSWVEVQARDGGHAKALVRAQYGNSVDILEAKSK